MTAVQALARTGVTCVATIHSPTAYCFSLFDRCVCRHCRLPFLYPHCFSLADRRSPAVLRTSSFRSSSKRKQLSGASLGR
jgi:hypothetical protein